MSLTDTLQKILAHLEMLDIPEGDYLTLSNDLKIVHDGIKKMEGEGEKSSERFPDVVQRVYLQSLEDESFFPGRVPNIDLDFRGEITKLVESHIVMVMDETNVSRMQAIIALINSHHDPFDAVDYSNAEFRR